MTKSEQIAVIRERCIEANPQIDNVRRIPVGKAKVYSFDSKDAVGREIQLADVLMAMQKQFSLVWTFNDGNDFGVAFSVARLLEIWYLPLPLSDQSPETIEFIYNIVR